MTVVQLGVIVFVLCLSTPVLSQSNATTPMVNSTSNTTMRPNATSSVNTTSAVNNTTTFSGAGALLHAGGTSFLVPVIMASYYY